jgi:ATPases involved in chromosome partitioning
MAKKICVVNTKGGVGKTTTAIHLAVYLSTKGKTLLIDGDPQQSAADWATWRRDNQDNVKTSPVTVCLSGKAIFDEGKELQKNYDYVVIDAGGRDAPGLRNALLLADFALIPSGASNLDAAAMSDLFDLINTAKDFNEGLKTKVLLTRIDSRTKDVFAMKEFLLENEINSFEDVICERVAFRRSVGAGLTVLEIEPEGQAARELQKINDAIFNEVQE